MTTPEDDAIDPELEDATVVVPIDDATIAVVTHDATIAVRQDDQTVAVNSASAPALPPSSTSSTGSSAGAGMSFLGNSATPTEGAYVPVTESATTSSRRKVGDPVEAPEEIPPELARLFFKNPLDPKRRAPESPFPKDQSSLPRGGVRSSIPVVYGTRTEVPDGPGETTEFSRWIGPPPPGYELPLVDRTSLPSTARQNRRFRLLALVGGAAVTVVTVGGLWVVVRLLLQS